MEARIVAELDLLRKDHPDLEYRPEGRWIRIPNYRLPDGWNRRETDVALTVVVGYPGTAPYGIYVPSGLLYNGQEPKNCVPAPAPLPFGGSWHVFSWSPEDGQWRPTADVVTGSNLRNLVRSFADRFRQGV